MSPPPDLSAAPFLKENQEKTSNCFTDRHRTWQTNSYGQRLSVATTNDLSLIEGGVTEVLIKSEGPAENRTPDLLHRTEVPDSSNLVRKDFCDLTARASGLGVWFSLRAVFYNTTPLAMMWGDVTMQKGLYLLLLVNVMFHWQKQVWLGVLIRRLSWSVLLHTINQAAQKHDKNIFLLLRHFLVNS